MKEMILTLIEKNDMENLEALFAGAEETEILYAFNDLSSKYKEIVFRLLSQKHALRIFFVGMCMFAKVVGSASMHSTEKTAAAA